MNLISMTRRSLLKRMAAMAGIVVVEAVLPRGVEDALAGGVPADVLPTGPYLVISDSLFLVGDPTRNDPGWLEELPNGGLLIRGRTMFVADRLPLPARYTRTRIDRTEFVGVGLDVYGDGAEVRNSRFSGPVTGRAMIKFHAPRNGLLSDCGFIGGSAMLPPGEELVRLCGTIQLDAPLAF